MIHCYKFDDKNIVLDVFSGSIHLVDEVAFDIIQMYEDSTREQIEEQIIKKHGVTKADVDECIEDIETLKEAGKLFTPDKSGNIGMLKYFGNTIVLWLMGAVPQIIVALLLAVFFTSYRLNIKGQQFFKTVIYMPNLIMAAAFSMLFFTLFSPVGPINQVLLAHGIVDKSVNFLGLKVSVRILISLMNFLMWFGNTTILLMAGIQGIDQNMFEAAEIDGANSLQVFFRVTLPLLAPILVYTIITAMIGGLQMFDVPQVLTNGKGTPDRASMTMVMYLNNYLGTSKNYGMAGAVSVVLFIVSAGLSLFVYNMLSKQYRQ